MHFRVESALFDLVDKALCGDASGAARCLKGLRDEGVEMAIILWGLTREIRNLLMIKQTMQDGWSFAKATDKAGVWVKHKQRVQQSLNRLSHLQLEHLLRCAHAIDKSIKGLRNSDPWCELLDLTLNLAGVMVMSPKNQRLFLKT